MRAEIHYPTWRLQEAIADVATNTMAPGGIALVDAPLLHFARRQDVVIWPLRETGLRRAVDYGLSKFVGW